MFGEFSEHTTSHPAVTATPVNHGAKLVLPNTATVPTPVGPEPMDLTVANANTRGYRCHGLAHEARNSATPDTRRRGQAFRVSMGGNHNRRDGGHDCTDIRCGCTGTLVRPVARGIINIEVAAVGDASMNDDGEDSAAEQEVGD